MVQIVLHVGMPKTATTTIQYTFAAQSDALLAGGVLFPKTGRPDGVEPCHHSLFLPAATSRTEIGTPLPEPETTFEGMCERLEAERRAAGASTIVLSSEMLWNPATFDRAALIHIRDTFGPCTFVIFAYLRPVASHAVSGYAQRVTGPQCFTGSFADHLAQMQNWGVYDYAKRLDDFATVFGREAVRPVWLPWMNRDVLAPFRACFPQLAETAPVKDLNQRRSWFFVSVIRWINVTQQTRFRRLGGVLLRLMRGLDGLAKRSAALERTFNPMDAATKQRLDQDTEDMLTILTEQYGVSQNVTQTVP